MDHTVFVSERQVWLSADGGAKLVNLSTAAIVEIKKYPDTWALMAQWPGESAMGPIAITTGTEAEIVYLLTAIRRALEQPR